MKDFFLPYYLEAVQQVLQQTDQLVLKGGRPDWKTLETLLVKTVILQGLRPNRKRPRLIALVMPLLWQLKLHPLQRKAKPTHVG